MIIKSGTYAFPVPGIQFNEHKLFLEAKEEDSEKELQDIAAYIGTALRQWADLTGADYRKKVNIDGLMKTKLKEDW